ncbi:MAG: hypothetical protein A2283_04285 [Lentisphaerae bacterium RIFOXYA12_FULL_48_11]|nr:MAG: hypothetical protein A2283_04285 [Lentisphaerae bacterium RIFOXYA12_FULL_48_11]
MTDIAENPGSNATGISNPLSVAAIVISIIAVLGMLFAVGLPFAVIAIILGHVSLSGIRKSGGNLKGYGISLAAVIMGYVAAVISSIVLVFALVFVLPYYRRNAASPAVRREVTTLSKVPTEERYNAVIKKLSDGKQEEAEELLESLVRKFPEDQRLAFMQAVCSRSRWAKSRAAWQLDRVLNLNPATIEGNCARYVLEIDKRRNVAENMNGLRLLLQKNADDPFLLWIMAVVCRDNYRLTDQTTYSLEAVECYRKLLKKFDVGPVLVHQTLANVLSEELDRDEEALVHRRIAVELEPEAWTYQGLANTLSALKKYDEANKTYEKLVSMEPYDADYWFNWANSLSRQKCYSASIAKCEKVLELDKGRYDAVNRWGYCLEMRGDLNDALKKYDQAIAMNPVHAYAYNAAARVLTALNKPAEAQKYRDKLKTIPRRQ